MILSGLKFIAREINRRADEEFFNADVVYEEMKKAHAELESGAISEEEFERTEEVLMDRLAMIEARRGGGANDDIDDDSDEDDAEDDIDADEDEDEDEDDEDDEDNDEHVSSTVGAFLGSSTERGER